MSITYTDYIINSFAFVFEDIKEARESNNSSEENEIDYDLNESVQLNSKSSLIKVKYGINEH